MSMVGLLMWTSVLRVVSKQLRCVKENMQLQSVPIETCII